jgi:DDE superfamily endonuclease
MKRNKDGHASMCEASLHTGVVIAGVDAFCQTITKKTVVGIDNASMHTSDACEERLPYWKTHGLIIKYLPPYSPELNLIAILWRRLKYTWLPFSAYEGLNALREALETILSHVGSEYQITFA